MKSKKVLLGALAIALVFGMAFIACDDGGSPYGPGGTTPGGTTPGGTTPGGGTGTPYTVGGTGPGGGKIFYYSAAGFTMTDNGQVCHYLETVDNNTLNSIYGRVDFNWVSKVWLEWEDVAGTGTGIGTGRKNTALILAKDPDAPAAKACKEYNGGGKTDWYLPSKDELYEVYKAGLLNQYVAYGSFWSSSQYDNISFAWIIVAGRNGEAGYESKHSPLAIHAVRAF